MHLIQVRRCGLLQLLRRVAQPEALRLALAQTVVGHDLYAQKLRQAGRELRNGPEMLAPIVLGYLGRQKRQQGMSSGMLGELLGTQSSRAQAKNPALGALAALLDKDDDGSIVDELGGMLGSFLSDR